MKKSDWSWITQALVFELTLVAVMTVPIFTMEYFKAQSPFRALYWLTMAQTAAGVFMSWTIARCMRKWLIWKKREACERIQALSLQKKLDDLTADFGDFIAAAQDNCKGCNGSGQDNDGEGPVSEPCPDCRWIQRAIPASMKPNAFSRGRSV